MNNIAQRLGLVIYLIGVVVTASIIVLSFADNLRELSNYTADSTLAWDTRDCNRVETFKRSEVKNGECYLTRDFSYGVTVLGKDYTYIQRNDYEASIIRWIQESIRTMFDYWIFLCGILYGWLIRFILAGKVHILPWK